MLFRRGGRCACCGPVGGDAPYPPPLEAARFEVDHKTPLWAWGRDDMSNAQVLCRECHRMKSGAEAAVRAVNRRVWDRLGFLTRRPSPVQAAFGVVFVTGVITSRWWVGALLLLAAFCFIPPILRAKRPWWTGSSSGRSVGFIPGRAWEQMMEESRRDIAGKLARRYWRGRMMAFVSRMVPIMVLSTYLAGVFFAAWVGWGMPVPVALW